MLRVSIPSTPLEAARYHPSSSSRPPNEMELKQPHESSFSYPLTESEAIRRIFSTMPTTYQLQRKTLPHIPTSLRERLQCWLNAPLLIHWGSSSHPPIKTSIEELLNLSHNNVELEGELAEHLLLSDVNYCNALLDTYCCTPEIRHTLATHIENKTSQPLKGPIKLQLYPSAKGGDTAEFANLIGKHLAKKLAQAYPYISYDPTLVAMIKKYIGNYPIDWSDNKSLAEILIFQGAFKHNVPITNSFIGSMHVVELNLADQKSPQLPIQFIVRQHPKEEPLGPRWSIPLHLHQSPDFTPMGNGSAQAIGRVLSRQHYLIKEHCKHKTPHPNRWGSLLLAMMHGKTMLHKADVEACNKAILSCDYADQAIVHQLDYLWRYELGGDITAIAPLLFNASILLKSSMDEERLSNCIRSAFASMRGTLPDTLFVSLQDSQLVPYFKVLLEGDISTALQQLKILSVTGLRIGASGYTITQHRGHTHACLQVGKFPILIPLLDPASQTVYKTIVQTLGCDRARSREAASLLIENLESLLTMTNLKEVVAAHSSSDISLISALRSALDSEEPTTEAWTRIWVQALARSSDITHHPLAIALIKMAAITPDNRRALALETIHTLMPTDLSGAQSLLPWAKDQGFLDTSPEIAPFSGCEPGSSLSHQSSPTSSRQIPPPSNIDKLRSLIPSNGHRNEKNKRPNISNGHLGKLIKNVIAKAHPDEASIMIDILKGAQWLPQQQIKEFLFQLVQTELAHNVQSSLCHLQQLALPFAHKPYVEALIQQLSIEPQTDAVYLAIADLMRRHPVQHEQARKLIPSILPVIQRELETGRLTSESIVHWMDCIDILRDPSTEEEAIPVEVYKVLEATKHTSHYPAIAFMLLERYPGIASPYRSLAYQTLALVEDPDLIIKAKRLLISSTALSSDDKHDHWTSVILAMGRLKMHEIVSFFHKDLDQICSGAIADVADADQRIRFLCTLFHQASLALPNPDSSERVLNPTQAKTIQDLWISLEPMLRRPKYAIECITIMLSWARMLGEFPNQRMFDGAITYLLQAITLCEMMAHSVEDTESWWTDLLPRLGHTITEETMATTSLELAQTLHKGCIEKLHDPFFQTLLKITLQTLFIKDRRNGWLKEDQLQQLWQASKQLPLPAASMQLPVVIHMAERFPRKYIDLLMTLVHSLVDKHLAGDQDATHTLESCLGSILILLTLSPCDAVCLPPSIHSSSSATSTADHLTVVDNYLNSSWLNELLKPHTITKIQDAYFAALCERKSESIASLLSKYGQQIVAIMMHYPSVSRSLRAVVLAIYQRFDRGNWETHIQPLLSCLPATCYPNHKAKGAYLCFMKLMGEVMLTIKDPCSRDRPMRQWCERHLIRLLRHVSDMSDDERDQLRTLILAYQELLNIFLVTDTKPLQDIYKLFQEDLERKTLYRALVLKPSEWGFSKLEAIKASIRLLHSLHKWQSPAGVAFAGRCLLDLSKTIFTKSMGNFSPLIGPFIKLVQIAPFATVSVPVKRNQPSQDKSALNIVAELMQACLASDDNIPLRPILYRQLFSLVALVNSRMAHIKLGWKHGQRVTFEDTRIHKMMADLTGNIFRLAWRWGIYDNALDQFFDDLSQAMPYFASYSHLMTDVKNGIIQWLDFAKRHPQYSQPAMIQKHKELVFEWLSWRGCQNPLYANLALETLTELRWLSSDSMQQAQAMVEQMRQQAIICDRPAKILEDGRLEIQSLPTYKSS